MFKKQYANTNFQQGRTKSLQILTCFGVPSNILVSLLRRTTLISNWELFWGLNLLFTPWHIKTQSSPAGSCQRECPGMRITAYKLLTAPGAPARGNCAKELRVMFFTKATSHSVPCMTNGFTSFFLSGVQSTQKLLQHLKLCIRILRKIENFGSKKQDFWLTLMYNLIKLDLNLE